MCRGSWNRLLGTGGTGISSRFQGTECIVVDFSEAVVDVAVADASLIGELDKKKLVFAYPHRYNVYTDTYLNVYLSCIYLRWGNIAGAKLRCWSVETRITSHQFTIKRAICQHYNHSCEQELIFVNDRSITHRVLLAKRVTKPGTAWELYKVLLTWVGMSILPWDLWTHQGSEYIKKINKIFIGVCGRRHPTLPR